MSVSQKRTISCLPVKEGLHGGGHLHVSLHSANLKLYHAPSTNLTSHDEHIPSVVTYIFLEAAHIIEHC